MQVLDDTTDTFSRALQTLADLMLHHSDDQALDGRTLSQCNEELDTLRSIQKRLERRVASVGRKRNAFVPINTLPPELLVTIFKITFDDEDGREWSIHENFMLVCHYWNHLVNNTPSLWTTIRETIAASQSRVIRALKKSKDSPLEIVCGTGPLFISQNHETAFLDAVFPHAHRWRKASLWLKGGPQGLEPMATLSAPLLESLSLTAYGTPGEEPDQPLDIFGGRPPAMLQELFLRGIAVSWSTVALCNLRTLKIESIHHLGPSLDQLFAILSASQGLKLLSIQDVMLSGDASVPLPNPIHMPTLAQLSLGIPPKMTNRILAAIHAPWCMSGTLRAEVQGDPFESLFTPDISHFFDRIRSRADAGSLECIFDSVRITWQGLWFTVLKVDGIRIARRVLDWLSVSPEHNSPAVPLYLTIGLEHSHLVEEILAVMGDMEAVHRVSLEYGAPVADTLRILATGSLVEGGTGELFPTLKEILIDKFLDDEEWEHLLRILRRRQREIEPRNGDQHLKPLRKLLLGKDWYGEKEDLISNFRLVHWPNRLEEVRRLLGYDGKLRWYRWTVTEDGTLEPPPAFPGLKH